MIVVRCVNLCVRQTPFWHVCGDLSRFCQRPVPLVVIEQFCCWLFFIKNISCVFRKKRHFSWRSPVAHLTVRTSMTLNKHLLCPAPAKAVNDCVQMLLLLTRRPRNTVLLHSLASQLIREQSHVGGNSMPTSKTPRKRQKKDKKENLHSRRPEAAAQLVFHAGATGDGTRKLVEPPSSKMFFLVSGCVVKCERFSSVSFLRTGVQHPHRAPADLFQTHNIFHSRSNESSRISQFLSEVSGVPLTVRLCPMLEDSLIGSFSGERVSRHCSTL